MVAVAASIGLPSQAWASCNVVPGSVNTFRAALGATDRPFAAPGDTVKVQLDLAGCEAAAEPGFVDSGNAAGAEDDFQVVLVFTPPNGPANVVVLHDEDDPQACVGFEGSAAQQACQASLPVLGDGAPGSTRQALCLPTAINVPDASTLEFEFPDTHALAGSSAPPEASLAGAVKIAVQPRTAASLPCGIASSLCEDGPPAETLACIDRLYDVNDTCQVGATQVEETFPNFTALPRYNDYEAMCDVEAGSPCDALRPDARFTIDEAGNLLVPLNWGGVLVRLEDGSPVPRLIQLISQIPAFDGSPDPVEVPGPSFVSALSPRGHFLPPILSPFTEQGADSIALFGTVDAPFSITRVARRGSDFEWCAGGAADGAPCNEDADCPDGACVPSVCHAPPTPGARSVPVLPQVPCTSDADCGAGAECGPSLLDFSTRFSGEGCGPALDTTYLATAGNLVPLESLFIQGSDEILALPRVEAIEAAEGSAADADFNQDGDTADVSMTLLNRQSGSEQPIGILAPGALGVASTQVLEPPYRYTAVSVEDDILAFLQYEPADFRSDPNANGRVEDSILRVYRKAEDDAAPNLPINPITSVDADSLVDGLPLTVSDGLVFYRVSEADEGIRRTRAASTDEAGAVPTEFDGFAFREESRERGAMSSDGRFVVYDSSAVDLVSGLADDNDSRDVFLLDRDADGDGLFDEPGQIVVELVSQSSLGALGDADSGATYTPGADVSDDGRFVVFPSRARTLVDPPLEEFRTHVYVRDRSQGTTTRASFGECEAALGADAEEPVISDDGAWVAFELSPQEGFPPASICVYEVATGEVDLILPGGPDPGNPQSFVYYARPSLSGDGRYLAFETNHRLSPHDLDESTDVYVLDRGTGSFVFASPGGDGGSGREPSISADGTKVAFQSYEGLVPEDDDESTDVYVFDVPSGSLQVLPSEKAEETYGASFFADFPVAGGPRISPDGRYVSWTTYGEGEDVSPHAFVADLVTGTTRFGDVTSAGVLSAGIDAFETEEPGLAERGLHTAFAILSSLVPGDDNGRIDVYLNGIGTAEPLGAGDLLGDGDLDDVVLYAFDARTAEPPIFLGPAGQVAVDGGTAAFLCPEDAVRDGEVDGNGDEDSDDDNVCLYPNRGAVQNLGQSAFEVDLSSEIVAARVEGGSGDSVVAYWDLAAGGWTPVTDDVGAVQTADSLCGVSGSVVAFTTLESDAGADRNGDGDLADRYAQAFDTATGELLGLAAGASLCEVGPPSGICVGAPEDACADDSDCLLGAFCDAGACRSLGNLCESVADCASGQACEVGSIIGIGTPELAQCEDTLLCENAQSYFDCSCDLDDDGDCCDPDEALGLAACQIRDFCEIADELDGCACDLNGDGDCCDDVLRAYDTALDREVSCDQAVTPCVEEACDPRSEYVVQENDIRFLTQECDQGTDPTIESFECGTGGDLEPRPGGDLNGNGETAELIVQICNARTGEVEVVGSVEGGQTQGNPLGGGDGSTAFVSAGICVQQTATVCGDQGGAGTSGDCPTDQFCSIEPGQDSGLCVRHLGTCRTDADCVGCDGQEPCADPGITCRDDAILAASGDRDGDRVSDVFDNCETEPNTSQADADRDGLGDACDLVTCGNGVVEFDEFCDDGNLEDGDGCPSDCRPPQAMACDVDGNDFIDRFDIEAITGALGQSAVGPDDPRDPDGDGTITIFDARACTLQCDRAECKPPGACGLIGLEVLGALAPWLWRRRRKAVGRG
ncbi:MAG: hypothetical protein ACQGVK_01525 [Myxococcota bacterium]